MKLHSFATALCLFAFIAALTPGAYGQEASEYVSYSWNQSTGDVYVYSEASTDYSTGYYYYVCTTNVVWWYGNGGAVNTYPACGTSDVQQDLYANVGSSGWIAPTGEFSMFMDYYASQFDPGCGCDGYYWDAYNADFLEDEEYSYPQVWYLPGPPGTPVVQQEIDSLVNLYASNCDFSISPGSISNSYCHMPQEQDQIFQANVSPGLSQCLPVSGSCSASVQSGDLSIGDPPQSCHIASYSITGDAYYYGPSSGNTGFLNLGFNLSLAQTNHSHSQPVEVTCP